MLYIYIFVYAIYIYIYVYIIYIHTYPPLLFFTDTPSIFVGSFHVFCIIDISYQCFGCYSYVETIRCV